MTTTTGQQPTLVVTGASGQLGHRVVELLLEARAGTVIAATRHPERLAPLAARGLIVRRADFEDAGTLSAAFEGGQRLLLVSTDAMGQGGQGAQQHQAAVAAAVRAGVRHIVYTSFVRPETGSPVLVAPDHMLTEQALVSSGLGWTVLRNNLYADLLVPRLAQAVATGRLLAAAGAGAAAYVSREDCARTAAAVLAGAGSDRAALDVTGPAAVTQAELARLASELTGRPVAYTPVAPVTLRASLVAGGLPGPVADLMTSFDVAIERGLLATVSPAVADLTGRAPETIAEFLASRRAQLAPTAPRA